MSENDQLRILAIEDDADDVELIRNCLLRYLGSSVSFDAVDRLAAAMERLSREHFEVVLLDLSLPDSTGIETFTKLYGHSPTVPIVILSGHDDEETALEAMRLGAQDYLSKDSFEGELLPRAVRFAIERSRRIEAERELRMAQTLQESLYPRVVPACAEFDIAGEAHPARYAGGDYFDFLALPHDTICVAVGDVSGHGLSSALTMVEVRAYLRVLTQRQSDPGRILTELNELLWTAELRHFVTLFLACLDQASQTLCFASAGHRGYLFRATGEVETLAAENPPLSIQPECQFSTSATISLGSGDLILLPTDGIEEAHSLDLQLFGEARMLEVIRQQRHNLAQDVVRALIQAARRFAGEQPQQDDITAVVVKVQPAG